MEMIVPQHHQQTYYYCVNRDGDEDSSTLGALVNHVEGGFRNCMRFKAVQFSMAGLVLGTRLLT